MALQRPPCELPIAFEGYDLGTTQIMTTVSVTASGGKAAPRLHYRQHCMCLPVDMQGNYFAKWDA